ncbi:MULTISPECIES: SHOCT domain-containing protein [unclassified Streptomyces]|uniref:SHOCT domain-containing protein n=1 Tax=unclassified Streptomyces TaxID=2593676 RepID=UPI000A71C917|nr:SHOCT domain-containing protein [Streptomyces polychromogenes]
MESQLLAYDYPLLGAFWTVLWIFLWVLWFMLLFRIIIDIFRDDTMGGWGKAFWLIFVVFLPFLGVLVYVIARGKSMGAREIKHVQEQRADMDAYIRETAGTRSQADELSKLAQLRASGDITEAEYQVAKEKILR